MRHKFRLTVMTALAAVLPSALVFTAAGQAVAHAESVPLSCLLGQQHTTFTPGLTNTARSTDITNTETYSLCVVLDHPLLTSGGGSFELPAQQASCAGEFIVVDNQITYTFGSGLEQKVSNVDFTTTVVTRQTDGTTLIVATGTVTSGFDAGMAAERTIVKPAFNLTVCGTTQGVTSDQGPATLTFS